MNSKRILATALIALTTMVGAMGEGIRIKPFTLAANEEKEIEILFDNSTDYGGLQFDLYLPEGVSIVEDEDGLYYYNTDRLKYKSGRKTVDFTMQVALMDGGFYRFLIYNTEMQNIAGESGEPILTVKLKASDRVRSSTQQIRVQGQVLSTVDAEETQIRATAFPVSLTVRATIGELGYATFSWPVDLDFTGLDLGAYIATECSNGGVSLKPVWKVPAGTGLLLKGAKGTYTLQTTYEECDEVYENLLTGTAYAEVTANSGNVFVLANKTEGLGFYRAADGLTIYQYKAYLESSSEARAFFLDDMTTGIDGVEAASSGMPVYTIEGQQVKQFSRAGIYIKGGKKIIVSGNRRLFVGDRN